ncbi:MAG: hypothetical protein V5A87_07050 [Candidatus Bipolaricaulota bacterium]|nr:hypothetical protein [Candidatus Bipolaricaulota bacterium]MBS3791923.1 hypothetical protein [Candidatus Bipolaricaulota bacterium]
MDKLTGKIPPPPDDSIEVYVELEEEDLYFLDAVIEGYDGIANVRREYREVEGDKEFRILTSPGCLDKTLAVIRDLRRFIFVGRITVEEGE